MALQKRTIRLARHNTSIALEPEFWVVLEKSALRRGLSLAQWIAAVDAARTGALASALRVAALKDSLR